MMLTFPQSNNTLQLNGLKLLEKDSKKRAKDLNALSAKGKRLMNKKKWAQELECVIGTLENILAAGHSGSVQQCPGRNAWVTAGRGQRMTSFLSTGALWELNMLYSFIQKRTEGLRKSKPLASSHPSYRSLNWDPNPVLYEGKTCSFC